jgi:hypothetical protein
LGDWSQKGAGNSCDRIGFYDYYLWRLLNLNLSLCETTGNDQGHKDKSTDLAGCSDHNDDFSVARLSHSISMAWEVGQRSAGSRALFELLVVLIAIL